MNGLSTFNLEMPERISRTEYLTYFCCNFVDKIREIHVSSDSDEISTSIEDPEDVYDLDFEKTCGIYPRLQLVGEFNNNYKEMKILYPDTVNMTGIYTTRMFGIVEILGWETLLTAAGIDSKAFGEFVNRYTDWNMQYFEALAKCDSPTVMVHDDIVWTVIKPSKVTSFTAEVLPKYIRLSWDETEYTGHYLFYRKADLEKEYK